MIFLWFAIKTKEKKPKQTTLTEIKESVKVRKQYLPHLKQLIGEYINRIEVLAKTDSRLCDLEQYKTFYPISKLYVFLARDENKEALYPLVIVPSSLTEDLPLVTISPSSIISVSRNN